MKIVNITILISCIVSALTCSAKKYQIKVLNTPTITIDKKEAKVGDWFDDESVIVWSKDNQAMRVVSEDNKVYTLSAKLYKEANAKKFSDFILYTKPLASRGSNDHDLIEQLAKRFDQDFIMLDEIVIDISDLDIPENIIFRFYPLDPIYAKDLYLDKTLSKGRLLLYRSELEKFDLKNIKIHFKVRIGFSANQIEEDCISCEVIILPTFI